MLKRFGKRSLWNKNAVLKIYIFYPKTPQNHSGTYRHGSPIEGFYSWIPDSLDIDSDVLSLYHRKVTWSRVRELRSN